jgi:outer membrane biosynthesis protein TonB
VSPFVYVAAAGAVAFGVMLAILVAKNTFQPPPAPAPAVAAVAPPAPLPAALPAPTQPLAIPDPAPVAPAVTPVAPVEPVPVPGAPAAHRGSKRPAAAAGNAGRTLSAAEQAEIDRMTGGGAGGPSLAVPVRQMGGGGGGGSQGAELSAEQLRTVVQRNRPGLQHCYEMAARQTGSTDTMRANVEVAVGGSGVVTRVSVTGSAPTQLTTCLESQVRRWHFPAGGEAAFPVVFSPGG